MLSIAQPREAVATDPVAGASAKASVKAVKLHIFWKPLHVPLFSVLLQR